MENNLSNNQMQTAKTTIDLPMTIISVAILFSFVTFVVIKPEQAVSGINATFGYCTTIFGPMILVFTFVTLIMSFYLAFSKYGSIRLGEDDPEYSYFSYVSMMTLAALASAALFWSFTEWAYYYMSPALGIEANSVEAMELSLGYAFFHWGLSGQCIYVLIGIGMAYAIYVKKVSLFRVSSVCEKMMGDFKGKNILCKLIDYTVIFGIIGALSSSLGLAVPLASGGLKAVFGIEATFPIQVGIIVFIALVFTFTSFIGTKKGMKNLSNFSATACICVLIFIFFVGPTAFIMKNTVNSFGWMLEIIPRASLFTDPVLDGGFPEDWTIYFQAFYLNYAAMMGIFIAKISKGRTIRQVTLAVLFGISAGGWFLFAINGSFAIQSQMTGAVDVTGLVSSGAGQDSIYQIIAILPGGAKLIPLLLLLITVGFVASSLDTASFSLAQTTSLKLDADGNPKPLVRVFWCLILTLVPLSIIFANAGFGAIKMLAIIISIPFMFVMIFMEIILFKWMKADMKKGEVIISD